MKILITESGSYSQKALEIYHELGEVTLIDGNFEEILAHLPEIEVLVVKLKFTWTESILTQAKSLKYIVTSTTGLNHIKLPLHSNIDIISLKGEIDFLRTITPTAELAWGLIISLVRNLQPAVKSVKSHVWDRNQHVGQELYGKVIGIIGYGRLGSIVTKYAIAFGMIVKVFDTDENSLSNLPADVEYLELDDLMKISDIITVHIPLVDSNINFIDKVKLSLLKHTAILINTSRGEIIDELYLLEMLETDLIAGVALDVLSDEVSGHDSWVQDNPLVNSNLLGNKLLITPHIGGACYDSMERTEDFVAKKLINEVTVNLSA